MSKSLIIYFSRADENYAVGYIDKGNTEIVAEFVQELTGADMFKVEPVVPYAKDYNTCIREAKQRIGNAPIKEKPTDISAYDTVFIMSPIYWGHLRARDGDCTDRAGLFRKNGEGHQHTRGLRSGEHGF